MKSITEYVNESHKDSDLQDIFDLVLKYTPAAAEYNASDGSKDVLGQSLKRGDIILVCGVAYVNRLCPGVYIGPKGSQVEYILVDGYDPDNFRINQTSVCRTKCCNVFKIDEKLLKD